MSDFYGAGAAASIGGREIDVSHLAIPHSKIDPYWIDRLRRLRGVQKQTTLSSLVRQLTPDNNLGFAHGKALIDKGSFFEYATLQRELHKDKIILLRSGEFYETYGIDAVMLVALCGLNPMGGKCKAGCPVKNVQQTLDDLTDNGLSVAVYEEIAEPEVRPGPAPKASKKKIRALTRIVTPASKTYPYELCLKSDEIAYSPNRPYVAIFGTVSGYDFFEIRLDEMCVVSTSRLTEKGVEALLRSCGCAEPVFTQNARLLHPMITSLKGGADYEELAGYSREDFSSIVLRRIFANNALDAEKLGEFRFVTGDVTGRPRCIYPMTQHQIGLAPNPNVPDLIEHLLPTNHAAHSARFLRKWLSIPPPYRIADQLQALNSRLATSTVPLPSNISPFLVGKVVSLLNARQCNVGIFRDVLQCTAAVQTMLTPTTVGADSFDPLLEPLLSLTSYETGVVAERRQLLEGCKYIVDSIVSVVQPEGEADPPAFMAFAVKPKDEKTAGYELPFPWDFFENNEKEFRSRVRRDHPRLDGLYDRVSKAAEELLQAIADDFPCKLKESSLTYDFHNNLVCLSAKPSSEDARPGVVYVHPVDRKGATLTKRYTTERVNAALAAYSAVVSEAPSVVERVLQRLCDDVAKAQMTVIHVSNFAMVLSAAQAHVVASLQKGWCIPQLGSVGNTVAEGMDLRDLSAYWMSRQDPATKTNDVLLHGMFLLTAPNMSGKSTLMRATLVAALLANAGLFVPCRQAIVPRYDSFSLRTASYDVPIEGKSAFAMEIDDMRVVLRDSSESSLVMIDEIGKGTSSREGSVLAAAILEELVQRKVSGIFATHLHELFQLPGLRLDASVRFKKMDTSLVCDDKTGFIAIDSKFTLEDGICTNSLALETARAVGGEALAGVCNRAAELSALLEAQEKQGDGGGQAKRGADLFQLQGENAMLRQRLAILEASLASTTSAKTATEPEATLGSRKVARSVVDVENQEALAAGAREKKPLSDKTSIKRAEKSPPAPFSGGEYSVDELRGVLYGLTGTKDGALVLESGFDPPAAYEGSSIVYVLQCRRGSEPPFIYVGETESIRERLRTHRRETFDKHTVQALVAKCPNKGAARLAETMLIKTLKAKGYDVRSDTDGSHRLFGSSVRAQKQ